jgi:hypothetical protein
MHALTALPRTLVATARWLVPWAGAVVVSSTLAMGVDHGLTRPLPDVPAPLVAAPARAGAVPTSRPDRPTPVGAQWVLLSSTDANGDPLEVACLVAKGQVAADVLDVARDDLGQVVTDLCRAWSS